MLINIRFIWYYINMSVMGEGNVKENINQESVFDANELSEL